MSEDLINFLMEYYQLVFLYAFKYLQDIKTILNTLHKDNAVIETRVNTIEKWVTKIEDDFKNCRGCEHLKGGK